MKLRCRIKLQLEQQWVKLKHYHTVH